MDDYEQLSESSYTPSFFSKDPEIQKGIRQYKYVFANHSKDLYMAYVSAKNDDISLDDFKRFLFGTGPNALGLVETFQVSRILRSSATLSNTSFREFTQALKQIEKDDNFERQSYDPKETHFDGVFVRDDPNYSPSRKAVGAHRPQDHILFETHEDDIILPAYTENIHEQAFEYARLLSEGSITVDEMKQFLIDRKVPYSFHISSLLTHAEESGVFVFSDFVSAFNDLIPMPERKTQDNNIYMFPSMYAEVNRDQLHSRTSTTRMDSHDFLNWMDPNNQEVQDYSSRPQSSRSSYHHACHRDHNDMYQWSNMPRVERTKPVNQQFMESHFSLNSMMS
eukprot:TRINITY_DN3391_c0_g1_i1.p1 TRINITY_DN3391_c0_g1~~TRINITY_DN3391_c0_g1_i1.p1  ORF type:complete len:337 (-),score=77.63 TRINITY_DN3391_c0_g1_i1:51-1061(-)